jgi:transmembrane sensor
VATVVGLEDDVTLRLSGQQIPATLDAPLSPGTLLETSTGRAALSFGNALSLRVDHATRLRIDGPGKVTLLSGSLYVDSGGLNMAPALRIQTPAGEVRHVGTQFQVFVANDVTRVRVREGRVLVEPPTGGAAQDLATGDELEAHGAQARVTHGMATFGSAWEWAAGLAPVFAIENRPLTEFLAWLTREHGWQLRYATETTRQQVGGIRLHGSFEGLDTTAMLERVTVITGVPLAVRDGVLWVGKL